jgi:hypothetical protein
MIVNRFVPLVLAGTLLVATTACQQHDGRSG